MENTQQAPPTLELVDKQLAVACDCGTKLMIDWRQLGTNVPCPGCAQNVSVPLPHESTLTRRLWLRYLRSLGRKEARACVDTVADREVERCEAVFQQEQLIDGKPFSGTLDELHARKFTHAVRTWIAGALALSSIAAILALNVLVLGIPFESRANLLAFFVGAAFGGWAQYEIQQEIKVSEELRMRTPSKRTEKFRKVAKHRANTDYHERMRLFFR